ncbi:MAG: Elongation factor Ts [Chloroflexi bacterium ADurb.Bin180]|nr:MAG: Elongation factor Ts [Chloroflexi bacterium ADurb.Bin180]
MQPPAARIRPPVPYPKKVIQMTITPEMIKELREKTAAGVLDCKKALEACGGDPKKAQELLREKGLAVVNKKATRVAKEGLVEAYSHLGKSASIVELNCETDFVARTPEFKTLAHEIAMQVVAARPTYLKPEDVPAEVVEGEKRVYRAQMADQNKPEAVLEKIIEGKLKSFYAEVCLLNQLWVKDQSKTIQDLIHERIAATGENIVLRRFARIELGEE